MRDAIETALANVTSFGDTDVFPYPVENHVFYDRREEVVAHLVSIDAAFDEYLAGNPVAQERSLAAIGYYGFRWATLIDPFWNAYLLALVVRIGADIEAARLPPEKNVVFSYRFAPDAATGTVFRADIGWSEFQARAVSWRVRPRSYWSAMSQIFIRGFITTELRTRCGERRETPLLLIASWRYLSSCPKVCRTDCPWEGRPLAC